jgi:hypothetical protein
MMTGLKTRFFCPFSLGLSRVYSMATKICAEYVMSRSRHCCGVIGWLTPAASGRFHSGLTIDYRA